MSDTLHVGSAINAWMCDAAPAGAVFFDARTLPPVYGLPVIVERDFHNGRWELRSDGETLKSGQVGDPDRLVGYVAGLGFVVMDVHHAY
jgi:hypothetical protein